MEPAVPLLRAAGMPVSDLVRGAYFSTHVDPCWPDALPVWFIQYRTVMQRDTTQDNRATGIAAVTLVVRDIAPELPQIAAFATVDPKDQDFPSIGAVGHVAAIPRGGAIRIVRPNSAGGPAGVFLREQGEGLMSVTFRVANAAAVAKLLADRRVPFDHEGDSLVVPPARGRNARMELCNR